MDGDEDFRFRQRTGEFWNSGVQSVRDDGPATNLSQADFVVDESGSVRGQNQNLSQPQLPPIIPHAPVTETVDGSQSHGVPIEQNLNPSPYRDHYSVMHRNATGFSGPSQSQWIEYRGGTSSSPPFSSSTSRSRTVGVRYPVENSQRQQSNPGEVGAFMPQGSYGLGFPLQVTAATTALPHPQTVASAGLPHPLGMTSMGVPHLMAMPSASNVFPGSPPTTYGGLPLMPPRLRSLVGPGGMGGYSGNLGQYGSQLLRGHVLRPAITSVLQFKTPQSANARNPADFVPEVILSSDDEGRGKRRGEESQETSSNESNLMSEDEATQDDTSSGSGSDSNNETHSISHQMKALLHDKRGVVVDVHIFSNEKRVNKSGRDSDEGEPFSKRKKIAGFPYISDAVSNRGEVLKEIATQFSSKEFASLHKCVKIESTTGTLALPAAVQQESGSEEQLPNILEEPKPNLLEPSSGVSIELFKDSSFVSDDISQEEKLIEPVTRQHLRTGKHCTELELQVDPLEPSPKITVFKSEDNELFPEEESEGVMPAPQQGVSELDFKINPLNPTKHFSQPRAPIYKSDDEDNGQGKFDSEEKSEVPVTPLVLLPGQQAFIGFESQTDSSDRSSSETSLCKSDDNDYDGMSSGDRSVVSVTQQHPGVERQNAKSRIEELTTMGMLWKSISGTKRPSHDEPLLWIVGAPYLTGALTESLDNLGVNGENVMIRESLTQLTSNDASGYIVFLREFDGNEKNTVKSFLRELAYFRKLVNTERERVTVFLCRKSKTRIQNLDLPTHNLTTYLSMRTGFSMLYLLYDQLHRCREAAEYCASQYRAVEALKYTRPKGQA